MAKYYITVEYKNVRGYISKSIPITIDTEGTTPSIVEYINVLPATTLRVERVDQAGKIV